MDEENKKLLQDRVTEFSPELQRLRKMDGIVTDSGDAMSDLHEREIAAIALFRALNTKIIPIPATMYFLENLASLRRSRDRMGRSEFVNILKGRPSYSINPYYDEPGGESKPGILQRIGSFFRRPKRQE